MLEDIVNSYKYALSMRLVILNSKNNILFTYILFDLGLCFTFRGTAMVAHLHSVDKW